MSNNIYDGCISYTNQGFVSQSVSIEGEEIIVISITPKLAIKADMVKLMGSGIKSAA